MRMSGLSRRGFLGAGSAGLGLLGAGGAWALLGANDATYRDLANGATPTVLTLKEFAVLDALASAIITPAKGTPSARDAQTARRIDRELAFHLDGRLVPDLKASLAFLEHLPAVDLRGTRFTALSPDGRAGFLEASARSPWQLRRLAYSGVRFLVLFFYYTDDRTWDSIGYAGPTVAAKQFEGGNRIENLPATVRGAPRKA